jgi:hypothetical protein
MIHRCSTGVTILNKKAARKGGIRRRNPAR